MYFPDQVVIVRHIRAWFQESLRQWILKCSVSKRFDSLRLECILHLPFWHSDSQGMSREHSPAPNPYYRLHQRFGVSEFLLSLSPLVEETQAFW